MDIESSFSSASLFPVSSQFRLGAANGVNDSNGEIDDFRIYNRALSIDEIARIYGGGYGDFYNHNIEFSYPEEYQLPIPLTVKFLRDGYPINVDGTFSEADITITSGNDSIDSPIKVSDGIYVVSLYPDNNTTDTNISVTVDGTSVSTIHFGEAFTSEDIVIEYRPETPQIISEDHSYWVRNQYSEFQVVAKNQLTLSASGLPDWMDFNASNGLLSGTPDDNITSREITISATNPAFTENQTHRIHLFDPSQFVARMELSTRGILSKETPRNLPGLLLQLDASVLPEGNGSQITLWSDSSGNGRDFDQYRGRPKVLFNQDLDNQKVVSFDGYSQLYSTVDFGSLIDSYSISALIRHTGGENKTVIGSIGTSWGFGLGDDSSSFWKMGTNLVNPASSADQNWHILTGIIKTDETLELWRDGFLILQESIPNRTDSKPALLSFGGAQANTDFSNSEIAEVLLYDRALKDSERRDIEDHLRLKWMRKGLENFPLLVRLSDGLHPDFSTTSFSDPNLAGDLRIYNEMGKPLMHQVDHWVTSDTEEKTIWVKVDKITPELRLIAYWGNERNTSTPVFQYGWFGMERILGCLALIRFQ